MAKLCRLWKQGHSTVIAVPFYMLDQLNLRTGDYLEVTCVGGDYLMCTPKKQEMVKHRVDASGKPFPRQLS